MKRRKSLRKGEGEEVEGLGSFRADTGGFQFVSVYLGTKGLGSVLVFEDPWINITNVSIFHQNGLTEYITAHVPF